MHWPNLRSLLGRPGAQAPPRAGPRPTSRQTAVPEPEVRQTTHAWPPQRLAVTDALWGDGYQFPGGELETLRLARPLGLSAASSLLLIGAGSGGPPCSVASHLGVWVTGFECEPSLAAIANERSIRIGLGRRAQVESWDPQRPDFGRSYFHHGIALDALRDGNAESILAATATALKPSGQFTLVDTVADAELEPDDAIAAGWARLDHRNTANVPAQAPVTRMLGRLGFEVRIVEDISHRYMQQALFGWRQLVGGLEQMRPSARQAAPVVAEAEFWLLQLRLFHSQKLRRVRWHAIGHGG